MKNNLLFAALVAFMLPLANAWAQTPAGFEDINLAPNSFYNGSDFAGKFKSGDYVFTNVYDSSFGGFWSGFAVSNTKNDSTPGHLNQYSSKTGGGHNSEKYGVFYSQGKIKPEGAAIGKIVKGFYITNNAYAYYEMKNGSPFSKKFGGASGNDPDYFSVEISAWKNGGNPADTTVTIYLADYRDANNANDYILDTWQYVDLSIMGVVDSFSFDFHSSDIGTGGINTPLYFCFDKFNDIASPVIENAVNKSFKVYPNPAREQLHIEANKEVDRFTILDMSGKSIMTGKGSVIEITELPIGIYLLQIETEGAVMHQKFIKE